MMDRETAEQVESIMGGVIAQIDKSIRIVMENCGEDEFRRYRQIAGKVMGEIFLEIREPIYAIYPDLTPVELRQDGKDYNA